LKRATYPRASVIFRKPVIHAKPLSAVVAPEGQPLLVLIAKMAPHAKSYLGRKIIFTLIGDYIIRERSTSAVNFECLFVSNAPEKKLCARILCLNSGRL
jgi:hypothetical protein